MHTVEHGRLPNHLRVVTVQRPHLHRVVVSAYVHVGSRHETRASNGLSHFLEHMLFRGTERFPSAGRFNHAIESLGGSLTAATHGDFTLFELTVPPDALVEGCEIVGEVFTSPVFSDLDIEKGIVREEILEDIDEDGRDVNPDNLLRASVFGQHSLGYPITGTVKNVDRFTERHLRAHLAQHYVARNMAVSVVGPVTHRQMRRAVQNGFDCLVPGAPCRFEVFHPTQQRARRTTLRSPGSQTALRIGFATAGQRAPGARALQLLMRVLDDGMSTRLHRRICDERGLAYGVSAGVELFDDVGILDVSSSVAPTSLPSLVGEVLSILGDLAVDGPTRAEVEKAHRRQAFDLDALEDDAQALGNFYGTAQLFDIDRDPARARRDSLSLTALDLRRAARRAFDPSRLNLSLIGSVDDEIEQAIGREMRRFRERLQRMQTRGRVAVERVPEPVRITARRRGSGLDLPVAFP